VHRPAAHWRSVQRRAARDVVSPRPIYVKRLLPVDEDGWRVRYLPVHASWTSAFMPMITSAYSNIYRLAKSADVTISLHATAASFTAATGRVKCIVPFGVDHRRVERCVAKARDFTVLFVGCVRTGWTCSESHAACPASSSRSLSAIPPTIPRDGGPTGPARRRDLALSPTTNCGGSTVQPRSLPRPRWVLWSGDPRSDGFRLRR
jgi:hypothetical protein